MRSGDGSRAFPSRHTAKHHRAPTTLCSGRQRSPCQELQPGKRHLCESARINQIFTHTSREREDKAERSHQLPSPAAGPPGLGSSALQHLAGRQPPCDAAKATAPEKGSESLCVAAFTDLSVPRKKGEIITFQTRFSKTGKKDPRHKRATGCPAKSPSRALT